MLVVGSGGACANGRGRARAGWSTIKSTARLRMRSGSRSNFRSRRMKAFVFSWQVAYHEHRLNELPAGLWNQSNPDSFCKTRGVGVPQHFRAKLRSRRHMRHVAPLSPVASPDCAYFLSPRCPPCVFQISLRLRQTQFGACPPWRALCFHILTTPFPATAFFSHSYKTPRGWGGGQCGNVAFGSKAG